MNEQQIYEGAIKIAGSLALEIPDNEAVITRSLALAKGIFGKLHPKPPEQPARAEAVATPETFEELPAELQADLAPQEAPSTEPETSYLDEVFLVN